ncbi:hypothetical protein ACFLXY_11050, partial [Chloroflexota bacterium]
GYRVSIKKPGVKPKAPKDIAVSIQYPDGKHTPPNHPLLVSDYKKKYSFDKNLANQIYTELEKLQNDKEPSSINTPEGCPGLPVNILVHALKWIWIQEDRNYPPPRYMGKRMNWSSYVLINNENTDLMSDEANKLLISHGYTSDEINKIRYQSRSRHLR